MNSRENVDGKNLEVSGRIFTWSNIISFSRVLIAFPIVFLHYKNDMQINALIIVLIIYGVISDYLDGLVARKTNTISEMGKMIDPIADKLCAVTLFGYTVWIGWIPLWFLTYAIIRDSLIMAGSFYIKKKYNKVAMSITSGKISVNVLALYWLSVFFFPEADKAHMFLLACTVTIMLISLFDYFNRYRKIMAGAKFN
ncbi:MAG: CDP-alcohol phosphatidyltransferase family protein [Balneolaceae bacterium]|nr:CDP-alcohol phosphatidyltransferase family protein [Balneolaceae bacterium]